MVARVTHYKIRAGKLEEFGATIKSLTAAMDELAGFRSLVVLRGEDPTSREAMAISVWDSEANMRDSDSNTHYYHAISKLIGCCESFSPMHVQEVLASRFAKQCG